MSNKFDYLSERIGPKIIVDCPSVESGLVRIPENSHSPVLRDSDSKAGIYKGVNSIDNSFSNVVFMDWSEKIDNLDFELLEQEVIEMGSSGSENCLDFGFKVFVANTKLKEEHCLVNGIDVSSVDISYEFVNSDKENSSKLLYEDLDTVSFFEKVRYFTFNDNLERDFIFLKM